MLIISLYFVAIQFAPLMTQSGRLCYIGGNLGYNSMRGVQFLGAAVTNVEVEGVLVFIVGSSVLIPHQLKKENRG